jgi:hypothetical protein
MTTKAMAIDLSQWPMGQVTLSRVSLEEVVIKRWLVSQLVEN